MQVEYFLTVVFRFRVVSNKRKMRHRVSGTAWESGHDVDRIVTGRNRACGLLTRPNSGFHTDWDKHDFRRNLIGKGLIGRCKWLANVSYHEAKLRSVVVARKPYKSIANFNVTLVPLLPPIAAAGTMVRRRENTQRRSQMHPRRGQEARRLKGAL